MSTKTTYEKLTKNLDRIADNLHQIGEQNNLVDLSLLSAQLGAIKEDLARLLWVKLPELNDGSKLEKLFNKSTGMFFGPGIFEIDAMRQAFSSDKLKHSLRQRKSNRHILLIQKSYT